MKQVIVDAILRWIEEHLEDDVNIADIVAYSGYSRRYVQDAFKNHVHITLGNYLRARKLCRTAVRLRLSSQSVTTIALQAGFDSTQSYSREFKKNFGVSPRAYRNSECWDLRGLRQPFDSHLRVSLSPVLVNLVAKKIYGHEINYQLSLKTLPVTVNPVHWQTIIRNIRDYKNDIFLLSSFFASRRKQQTLSVKTFIGTTKKYSNNRRMLTEELIPAGLYARFYFTGGWHDYRDFSRAIYMCVLPKYNLMRRKGIDIENFYFNSVVGEEEMAVKLKFAYYIPVSKCSARLT